MEWNELLLKVTGGSLSLTKCNISILKWKGNYWGIQKIANDDNKSTIYISVEGSKRSNVPLERLEPHKAERILGLRLPMTGSMSTEEYEYRKNNVKT